MSRTTLAAALAAIIAAVAVITVAAPTQAQTPDEEHEIVEIAVVIAARRLDDGRVEFGWQFIGRQRDEPILLRKRYLPADAQIDRWLSSEYIYTLVAVRTDPRRAPAASSQQIAAAANGRIIKIIGRVSARRLSDGRIEAAFTPIKPEGLPIADGERILPEKRYFPAAAAANRWLRSSEIIISISLPAGAIVREDLKPQGAQQ